MNIKKIKNYFLYIFIIVVSFNGYTETTASLEYELHVCPMFSWAFENILCEVDGGDTLTCIHSMRTVGNCPSSSSGSDEKTISGASFTAVYFNGLSYMGGGGLDGRVVCVTNNDLTPCWYVSRNLSSSPIVLRLKGYDSDGDGLLDWADSEPLIPLDLKLDGNYKGTNFRIKHEQ